ncbi:helix-turn-helix domain-containing protein [Clostridium beijerinckii]|uniref:helix-turn-helix domain-containing protein n=1 Tax=Clostridium beijerinckii TaxID=1520 RepID=UPI0013610BC0|nr:helix-turn-helix domain-containing protein [Clostridium beijerinckii]MZK53332.1 helix-turn-helix domain-containing protein [Clostridium beijerinckii]MZK61437.1 helix-turn-helix domain-containing protein [Clostridium beijerinckii]MZK71679.1 helix-turn-helix domain-containing protein [Clostridium beijerinckii]MZK77072.1 helix-turn-helix domain-containing protein [Clostridium beijerinckii]MZK86727.1 helix-turn-helix domain-containing protein [Clostridium beijerinckii]
MDDNNDRLQITGVMSKGYGIMPKMVALDTNLSIEAKAIYAFLTSFSGIGQGVFPSIETIIHYLNISENRFLKYRKELINNGYITIKKRYSEGKRTSNLYILNMEVIPLNLQNECIENKGIDFECIGNEGTNNNNINNNKLNNNNTNSKKKKETDFDIIINSYTNNEELKNNIYEFIKMRKGIKAAITSTGLKRMLSQLDKLSNNDSEKIQILDKSIMNSWRGIFALKEGDKNNVSGFNKQNNSQEPQYDFSCFQ